MDKIKNSTTVNINKVSVPKRGGKPMFAAETPEQKARQEAMKKAAYTAGKYIKCFDHNTSSHIRGLLVAVVEMHRTAYYAILDKDRHIRYIPVSGTEFTTFNASDDMDMSVLDWLKWHETEFLVDTVKKELEEKGYKLLTKLTINWQRQYGPKEEKPATDRKSNKTQNKNNKSRK